MSRPGTTNAIALVYDLGDTALISEVQLGMLTVLRGSDIALLLLGLDSVGDDVRAELADFLERQRPAGALVLPPLAEAPELARLCAEAGCAAICLGAGREDDPAPRVRSADRVAAAEAVAYLISLGHQRIGMITGPEDSRIAQQRELGYLDAMADHELDRGPSLITAGDNGLQSGYAAALLLFEVSPRPTAIFAANDEMAAGAIQAASKAGIAVPEELSVIGFDDAPIAARLAPPLTTLRVPLAEMAREAVLRLVAPEAVGNAQPFSPELVTRDSTGPCPA